MKNLKNPIKPRKLHFQSFKTVVVSSSTLLSLKSGTGALTILTKPETLTQGRPTHALAQILKLLQDLSLGFIHILVKKY